VVRADGGGIVQLHAIGQHPHARAIHAADDGAAGPGAKVRGVDAGLPRQAVAQRGGAAQLPGLALQHADGRRHVLGAQAQAGGGHGDAGQLRLGRVGGLGLGQRQRAGGQGDGQGHRVVAQELAGGTQRRAGGGQRIQRFHGRSQAQTQAGAAARSLIGHPAARSTRPTDKPQLCF